MGNKQKKQTTFNDTVLLRINRQFTHDEAVRFLESEISRIREELKKCQFHTGELISENTELKDELIQVKKIVASGKSEGWKEVIRDPLVIELKKENLELRQKKNALEKEMIRWRDKYLALNATITTRT